MIDWFRPRAASNRWREGRALNDDEDSGKPGRETRKRARGRERERDCV